MTALVSLLFIQYSSTVYRDHEDLGFLAPEYHPKINLTKPKNVFRSTINPSMKLICKFKNFLFNRIFYWLTELLMPSNKHNSIMAVATGLISSLFNVTLSGDMPFCQLQQVQCLHHGSTKAHLCSPLSSIPFSTDL